MKKILFAIISAACFITTSLAQETTYYFKKPITVGCYNANPLTDMTKKVVFSENGDLARITIASIMCSKDFDLTPLGSFVGSEKIYYSADDERGVILEGADVLYVFKKEDDKYMISAVAHLDKKTAKTLDTKTGEDKYLASLTAIDNKLADAKSKAKAAAKIAATYEIPAGNYTDKYGISGVYYLSELSWETQYGSRKENRYIKGVNVEFDYESRSIKMHYGPDKTDNAYFRSEMKELIDKGVKDGPTYFSSSNQNMVNLIDDNSLLLIEDGVFFIEHSSWMYINTDCDKPKWQPKDYEGQESYYVLMGKDSNRVKELMNDPEQVKELTKAAKVKDCMDWNIYREAKNPMPAKGMTSSSLQADVTQAAINGAASRGWKEEIVYAYVQSKEWFTLRNKATGIITGRELVAVVVMKTDAGTCKWEQVTFRQNYDGANYGGTYWYGNSQRIYPVDCKEAMKYK